MQLHAAREIQARKYSLKGLNCVSSLCRWPVMCRCSKTAVFGVFSFAHHFVTKIEAKIAAIPVASVSYYQPHFSLPLSRPMSHLIVLFNLKAGKSRADYEAWALRSDLPCVNSLKSVDSCKILRSNGLMGSGAAAPFQYIEVIEVNSTEGLFVDFEGPIMQKISAQFREFADNPIFVVAETLV